MNIVFLKQAVKEKVNSHDTIKALKSIVNEALGGGDVTYTVVRTSDIVGVGAGCNILVATTNKSNKIILFTVGASNQDFTCMIEDNKEIKEEIKSFEYAMFISKKLVNTDNLDDILNEAKNNKDLAEAMLTIGRMATNARYTNLISGSYGEVINSEDNSINNARYSGVVVTDLMNKDKTCDIETEVISRKGKLHLFQVIPLLKEEMEIVKEFEDSAIADVIAASFIYSDKDTFTNRKKLFNFSDVINAHTVDRNKLEEAGIKFEKDKPLINTLEHINKVLELKSN